MSLLVTVAASATLATADLPPTCTAWGTAALTATCDDCPRIDESSGVVPAQHRAGVWFTHNDAGGEPDLYAFDESGVHLETHSVTGGGFRDWEDLASGPCPAGVAAETCLYIGDVGDNSESRDEIDIWVVAEPEPGASAPVVANWRLRYPAGAHDCEAVVVHPCTGRIYLLTKEREGEPVVFRAPLRPTGLDAAVDLELVTTLSRTWFGDSGLITGADWSAAGDRLVVRTYNGGWIWETDPADPDAHWTTPPTDIPIDVDGQGESIAFHPNGGVLTTTERTPMRIVHLPCATSEPATECPPREPLDTGAPMDTAVPADSAAPVDSAAPDDSAPADDTAPPVDSSTPVAATPESTAPAKGTCGCGGAAAGWVVFGGLLAVRRRRD